MIKKYSIVIIPYGMLLSAFLQIKYPATRKVNREDDYFGTKLSGPDHWLDVK